MIYPIQTIANWFIDKEPMTHQKVQKLCYYAQAWSFALRDTPLVDEPFEAWVHGPVSPALYEEFQDPCWKTVNRIPGYDLSIGSDDIDLLEDVWITYGDQSGNALESLTHSEPPWILARGGLGPYEKSHRVISAESMKDYYKRIYLDDGEA